MLHVFALKHSIDRHGNRGGKIECERLEGKRSRGHADNTALVYNTGDSAASFSSSCKIRQRFWRQIGEICAIVGMKKTSVSSHTVVSLLFLSLLSSTPCHPPPHLLQQIVSLFLLQQKAVESCWFRHLAEVGFSLSIELMKYLPPICFFYRSFFFYF